MNLSLTSLSSWIKVSLFGLAGVTGQTAAHGVLQDTQQTDTSEASAQYAAAQTKPTILYIDYDNVVSGGDIHDQFQANFTHFLEALKASHFSDTDLNIRIFGNLAFHFPGERDADGELSVDTAAFNAWQQALPIGCEVHDTPTRKSKGKTNGKTRADAMIMFGLQHDAFVGHPVALMSNDVDFDNTLNQLQARSASVTLFTNKICHRDLKSALPGYVDAREMMLDSGLSSVKMALNELSMLPPTLNYFTTRKHFSVYSRKNWQGAGSFRTFLELLAPGLDFDFSHNGTIRVSPVAEVATPHLSRVA